MIYRGKFVAVLLAVLVCGAMCVAPAYASGVDALDQAVQLKQQKKFGPAADAFDRALEQGGLNSGQQGQAYSGLAFCARYLRDHDRTIAACTKWIKLEPGNADAYRLRGMALRAKKQSGKALGDFCTATRLAPDAPQGYYDRATALVDLGELKLAYTDINKALKLYGKPNNTYGGKKREIEERLRNAGIQLP